MALYDILIDNPDGVNYIGKFKDIDGKMTKEIIVKKI